MRIIAGEARGRVLQAPHGRGTRPTDSRSREALFNILGSRVVDARVLDLYAGSGAIGLEALSRGAESCLYVEQNAGAANAIRNNLKNIGWNHRGQVWQTSVKSALHRLDEQMRTGERSQAFHIIFADPPFTDPQTLEDIAKRVDTFAQLLHNVEELSGGREISPSPGLLIVQHQHRTKLHLSPRFQLQKSRRAGESLLSFFEYMPEPPGQVA